jgi:hypothetical protein
MHTAGTHASFFLFAIGIATFSPKEDFQQYTDTL